MFNLKKNNVVKIVDTVQKKDKLISQGYELISTSEKAEKNEKDNGKGK